MTDKPILFSAQMIRALLAGTKAQTRRTSGLADVNETPDAWSLHNVGPLGYMAKPSSKGKFGATFESRQIEPGALHVCPQRLPIAPGVRLWVKETFQTGIWRGQEPQVTYRATMEWPWDGPWRSPIFMPRKLSRLTLIVTDVRVQRLQEITYPDTRAEGIETTDIWQRRQTACLERNEECGSVCRDSFRELWNSLHGPDSWDQNPWVAAYSFDVHRGNIDQMEGAL